MDQFLTAIGFVIIGAAAAVVFALWWAQRRTARSRALPPPIPVVSAVAVEPTLAPAEVMTDLAEDTIAVHDAIDPALFPVFEEEACELLERLEADLRRWTHNPDDPAPRTSMLSMLQLFKGSARVAGAMQLGECAQRMEAAIETLGRGLVGPAGFQRIVSRFDTMQTMFDTLRDPVAVAAERARRHGTARLDALTQELDALAAVSKPGGAVPVPAAARSAAVTTEPAATIAAASKTATASTANAPSSESASNAALTLVLPPTTAAMEVVMLRAGMSTIGVASDLVEQVHQIGSIDLELAYRRRTYPVGDANVPFFWAGELLQPVEEVERQQQKDNTVVVVRSAGQRVAVHVDKVLGNQDVVIENLGPRLSRLPGLPALAVLASGSVALIYSPVPPGDEASNPASDLPAPAPAAAQASTTRPAVRSAAALAGQTPSAAAAASALPLILVVDDSVTVRAVAQRLLQREGYRVALAVDGMQALSRLQEERPAVMLSDVEMPRMDGFDLARNVRADDALAGLPIIMITSRIAEKHREHARQLGVNHYLGKPYAAEELIRLVRLYTGVMPAALAASAPAAMPEAV